MRRSLRRVARSVEMFSCVAAFLKVIPEAKPPLPNTNPKPSAISTWSWGLMVMGSPRVGVGVYQKAASLRACKSRNTLVGGFPDLAMPFGMAERRDGGPVRALQRQLSGSWRARLE